MMDMLVRLYALPDLAPLVAAQAAQGVTIRRALAPEKHVITDWVRAQFGEGWGSECEVAFGHRPIGCYIAVRGAEVLGFGCYDVVAKGMFGPTGVAEAARGTGIGKALLVACLHSMFMEGYAYAIIGGVGPADFYARAVGATPIEGSDPGIYAGLLSRPPAEAHPEP